jgi:hypothetical protein
MRASIAWSVVFYAAPAVLACLVYCVLSSSVQHVKCMPLALSVAGLLVIDLQVGAQHVTRVHEPNSAVANQMWHANRDSLVSVGKPVRCAAENQQGHKTLWRAARQ